MLRRRSSVTALAANGVHDQPSTLAAAHSRKLSSLSVSRVPSALMRSSSRHQRLSHAVCVFAKAMAIRARSWRLKSLPRKRAACAASRRHGRSTAARRPARNGHAAAAAPAAMATSLAFAWCMSLRSSANAACTGFAMSIATSASGLLPGGPAPSACDIACANSATSRGGRGVFQPEIRWGRASPLRPRSAQAWSTPGVGSERS
mmetsp:Transcript_25339/g.75421  ORF Transcript_25339/g.75421 Transcript_25339/m.75421 type:complete len:204 (+) Transcript_25339:1228-1839(+)